MKRQWILSLVLLVMSSTAIANGIYKLNNNWRYTPGYEVRKNVFNHISLPHTWNTQDALGGKMDYYRGLGNYEKDIDVLQEWEGKRLFLKFYGVNTVANVFINGKHVGEHRGGYTAFIFEITDFVNYGHKNSIWVRVNNAPQLDIMPLVGDFNMYGGIYRDVELMVKNATCISPLHYGSSGIYLKQKEVSRQKANIESVIMLSGQIGEKIDATVSVRKENNEVLTVHKQVKIGENGEAKLKLPFTINEPRLWNGVADPFMYNVSVAISVDGEMMDEAQIKLGLRFFHVDPEKGFFLNGEHLQLRGVCRHQDRPELGNAISDIEHEEDVTLMLEMGANAVRLSHYPQDPYIYELLDEAGLVVWSEIPFVGPGGYRDKGFVNQDSFKENGRMQLKEMIYQQYNHPSICFWGLFNELKEEGDNPIAFVKELDELAKKTDPSRITTAASNQSGDINRITDIIGWNLYFGWYGGTPGGIGKWADETRKKHPETPIGISEYGAGASIYHQQEKLEKPDANSYWHPENWQTHFHEQHWMAIDKRPFLWGTFIWNLYDFGAAHRTEGEVPGKNDKGLVTFDRSVKKDAFYFYKANWNKNEPLVYIAERRLRNRSQQPQNIKIYSNEEEVELFINGKSLGKKQGSAYGIFIWNGITLDKGPNHLLVRTNNDVIDETTFHVR